MFELRPYRRNSINVWNPFSEMEEMEKRLFNNNFFSNFNNWFVVDTSSGIGNSEFS